MNKIFLNLLSRNKIKKFKSKKKILITGSSGFIGDHLVQVLTNKDLNYNFKIYGIDIVKPKKKYLNFKFIKKSLLKVDPKDIPNIKFDYIIHLAGIPSPTYYKKNPLGTIFLNSNLAEILLRKAQKDNSKFIYFSSSEIYGNPDKKNIPTNENYKGYVSSISDRSCYDESKRMGETLTYIYKNYLNVDCKIIRPFNFYGNGMRYNDKRIIPQFFFQAINKKNITVFSSGKQTRTYCHIYDATIMLLKIIFEGKDFVYNVGNSLEEISALKLAKKIKNIFSNNRIKIKTIPYPKDYPSDEPERRCPNMKKFFKEFNYRPRISLDKGLKLFQDFAKKSY